MCFKLLEFVLTFKKKCSGVATPDPRSERGDPSRTLPRTAFGRISADLPTVFFHKSNPD